ncbi:unnamed protein product [Didymodactylos carnosus]|uniref:Pectin acetylesterase n=1 Tax=Didymodactylos carnosus TaxID=1234261 RepID=A0A8S2CQS6_9BILA|nr:unnamed protein product [Didymodactylos carnosus]CAF3561570.1 unnamed protein product [Didymodactylos carnosus]
MIRVLKKTGNIDTMSNTKVTLYPSLTTILTPSTSPITTTSSNSVSPLHISIYKLKTTFLTRFHLSSTSSNSYRLEIFLTFLLCIVLPIIIIFSLIFRKNIIDTRQEETLFNTSTITTSIIKNISTIILDKTNDNSKIFFPTELRQIQLNEYPDARCNDGSQATYYLRHRYFLSTKTEQHTFNIHVQSRRWLIFLDGGWYCHDLSTCEKRQLINPLLTSSKQSKDYRYGSGILSSSSDESGPFTNYNIIYIPYCSSDLWTGTMNSSSSNSNQIQFSGYNILKSVLYDLYETKGLHQAKQIIFSGTSAGGLGVLITLPNLLNDLPSILNRNRIDIRAIIDSAWFIEPDNDSYGSDTIQHGIDYWKAKLPLKCKEKYKNKQERWKCFLGDVALESFEKNTQLIIIQSLTDNTQLLASKQLSSTSYLTIDDNDNDENIDRLRTTNIKTNNFTLKLIDSLKKQSHINIFATGCPFHGLLLRADWLQFSINDKKLSQILIAWLRTTPSKRYIQLIDRLRMSYCPITVNL